MLMDLETLGWSEELCDAIGVPISMLPRIVPSVGVIADATGPLAGVPIAGILGEGRPPHHAGRYYGWAIIVGDGYVLSFVTDAREDRSELWIYDAAGAQHVAAHGAFVPFRCAGFRGVGGLSFHRSAL